MQANKGNHMHPRRWLSTLLVLGLSAHIQAQTADSTATQTANTRPTDTLRQNLKSYTARNFSELRTLNLRWETLPSYRYKIKGSGESGRMESATNVHFQSTFPFYTHGKLTLAANVNMDYYHLEPDAQQTPSTPIFPETETGHIYYWGSLAATYHTQLFKRPLLLIGSVEADGWHHGLEYSKVNLMASMLLYMSRRDRVTVGLYANYPFKVTPIIPLVVWTHQFSPRWTLDATLPNRAYLRYQRGCHRLSAGVQMEADRFYLHAPAQYKHPQQTGTATYFYSNNYLKQEVVYECILNHHFYFIARGGFSTQLKGGLYNTDRSGHGNNPLVGIKTSPMPYLNLGISYNLFK